MAWESVTDIPLKNSLAGLVIHSDQALVIGDIAMAEYAPVFNLHQLLWSVPGFSFLRAPARFSYLVVFACACLAAFGLEVLSTRRRRTLVAVVGASPAAVLLVTLLALLPTWRTFLLADDTRGLILDRRFESALDELAARTGAHFMGKNCVDRTATNDEHYIRFRRDQELLAHLSSVSVREDDHRLFG